MLFYTPESAKTRLGRHKPDLWIVTEEMTIQQNQPWRADRTTPVILITGNPDAVEIKKNSGKLTVLSMPLSIVDLRKTVEIYVSGGEVYAVHNTIICICSCSCIFDDAYAETERKDE